MIINILGCKGIGKTTIIKEIEKKYPKAKIYYDKQKYSPHIKGNIINLIEWKLNLYDDILTSISQSKDDELIVLDDFFYINPCLEIGFKVNLIDYDNYLRLQNKQLEIAKKHEKTLEKIKCFILYEFIDNIYKKTPEEDLDYVLLILINMYYETLKNSFVFREYCKDHSIIDVDSLKKGVIPKEINVLIEN